MAKSKLIYGFDDVINHMRSCEILRIPYQITRGAKEKETFFGFLSKKKLIDVWQFTTYENGEPYNNEQPSQNEDNTNTAEDEQKDIQGEV